jgi:AcrR family transcriptional regulator
MVETPWGPSDRLREGRLRPGPATSRAEVEMSQRKRLFGAMVASVSERGYAATRLEDLVELSGVSTASFYRLFASKDACFLAALEELLKTALVATEFSDEGTWEERVRRPFTTFAQLVSSQPAAARMVLIDSFAAGPEVTTAIDHVVQELQRRAIALVHDSPERTKMPDVVPAAMVGAVQELARDRLRRGRADALPNLMEQVADVALSYRPPAEPLTYTGRLPRAMAESLEVPGAADRAIRALAVVAADRGYGQVTVEEIVKQASMSPTTFYAEFADKREAMLAAIDSAGAQMVAATLPAFRRNADWPAALRTAFIDLLAYLASRPALARLVFVEAYAAGTDALQRRAEALSPLTALLAPGAVHTQSPSGVVTEIVWAAVLGMIQQQIRESGAHTLPALAPSLTFIALGPYLGSDAATGALAIGGRRSPDFAGAKAIRSFYAHPKSDEIEKALNLRPVGAEELAVGLGLEQPEVERLLALMLEAGLIRSLEGRTKSDPIRGPYEVTRDPTVLTDASDAMSIAERRSLANFVAGNLQSELRESFESEMMAVRPEYILVRIPMAVDYQGWQKISGLLENSMHEVIAAVEESSSRLDETGEPPIRATASLLLFELPEDTL